VFTARADEVDGELRNGAPIAETGFDLASLTHRALCRIRPARAAGAFAPDVRNCRPGALTSPGPTATSPRSGIIALCSLVAGLSPVQSNGVQGGRKVATHGEESSLVLVVGFEGSDPARRALQLPGVFLEAERDGSRSSM
jgi:hypothetical protein